MRYLILIILTAVCILLPPVEARAEVYYPFPLGQYSGQTSQTFIRAGYSHLIPYTRAGAVTVLTRTNALGITRTLLTKANPTMAVISTLAMSYALLRELVGNPDSPTGKMYPNLSEFLYDPTGGAAQLVPPDGGNANLQNISIGSKIS